MQPSNSPRIHYTLKLIAYDIALITILFIFIFNLEQIDAQESADVDDQLSDSAEQAEPQEEDTTPPVITVPDDISELFEAGEEAIVSFKVSAKDDVDGAVDVDCQPPSGSIFLEDETTVKCTATDAAGNTATKSFTVIVNRYAYSKEPGFIAPEQAQQPPLTQQAQQPPLTQQPLPGGGGGERMFQSATDSFQVQVPPSWVVEDINNTDFAAQASEEQNGYTLLARICPQYNALPLIDSIGKYQCQEGSTATASIMRVTDLYERPEFASLGNRSITTSDLLSYYIGLKQNNSGITNIQIWNNTDTMVNIMSGQTDPILATVPGKLLEYTYYKYSADDNRTTQYREFSLLVLNGTTGYSLFYEGPASSLPPLRPPSQIQQIFDSFALLTEISRDEEALKL